MSVGIVVDQKRGRIHSDRLYIKLKNGSIYCHKTRMSPQAQSKLLVALEAKGRRVALKHWQRVPDRIV